MGYIIQKIRKENKEFSMKKLHEADRKVLADPQTFYIFHKIDVEEFLQNCKGA